MVGAASGTLPVGSSGMEQLLALTQTIADNSTVAREQAALAFQQAALVLDLQLGNLFPLLSTRNTNGETRLDAAKHYNLVPANATTLPSQLRCMLMDTQFPAEHVIQSHIFQRNWQKHKSAIHLVNVDDYRNCIFLYKPIKSAFDHGHLVFLWKPKSQSFACQLLNQDLRNESLDAYGTKFAGYIKLTKNFQPLNYWDTSKSVRIPTAMLIRRKS